MLTPSAEDALKNAARNLRLALGLRDECIIAAAREGATLREIAAAVGMSNPGVLYVLRKHQQRSQQIGGAT